MVSVLWGLSILSLIAAAILAASVLSSHLERNEWDAASRRMTEDAALNRAVLGLLDPRPEKRWRVDGASQIFEFQGTKIRISIEDELGKIDLNTAGDDLIRRLFHSVGLPPDEGDALTDRVLDWRAPGVGKRLNGADERDYRGAGLSY
ncbi:MAG TPA: type II secretion system protein GspK, partial [Parvibaculum sp.]|nr:type II secretion system protein GspK [Parvibaculum sp.]